MTWSKIDDRLHGHIKTRRAGVHAMGLWVLALSYCSDNQTNGHINANVPSLLAGKEGRTLAGKLVAAGLWEVDGAGWRCTEEGKLWSSTSEDYDPAWAAARRIHSEGVFERDEHRCVYCGYSNELTIDHVLPRSRGGSNDPSNLVTACRPCNSSKGARTPDEWRQV